MKVLTFIEAEKAELITEPEKWCAEVEALGLDGQKKFIPQGDAKEAGKGIVPFMKMTPEMFKVYKELFPDRTTVKSFNAEPIPLRALSMIALAQKECYFKEIYIMHKHGHPDPLVVGLELGGYDWNDNGWYLLAQWGPEIETFAEAKARAVKQWAERFRAQLQERLSDWAARMNSADGLTASALRFFENGEKPDVDIPF